MIVYVCSVVLSLLFTAGVVIKASLFSSFSCWLLLAILIWLGFYLGLIALFFLFDFLVSLTVDKKKPQVKVNHFFRWLLNQTAVLILILGKVKIKATGLEKLEGLPPFQLVANHRSNFDPFIALKCCPKANLAYIAKPEIFQIPITGAVVHKCFFLSLDREDPRQGAEVIKHASELLKEGKVSIGVYPEGTRSKTGELLPFRNGCFKIAKWTGCPLVIARTTGTELVAHRFARKSTTVTFEILDVLSPEQISTMTTWDIGEYVRSTILGERSIK